MSFEQTVTTRRAEPVVHEVGHDTVPSTELAPQTETQEAALRALDIVLTSTVLLFFAPLFIIIALAVRLDSPGPVLFVQKRVGRNGKIFPCYKFRSMLVNAEEIRQKLEAQNERGGPVFKMKNDPRITRVGKLLRKSSLDELPQLLNVIKGDMSLVGPRPAIPSEVEKYTARERERLLVTPGLTGLWQVSGRASVGFDEMIDMDLEYVQKRSVWFNIVLLAKTIPAVVTARGAY